jgi:hypothetical protein
MSDTREIVYQTIVSEVFESGHSSDSSLLITSFLGTWVSAIGSRGLVRKHRYGEAYS